MNDTMTSGKLNLIVMGLLTIICVRFSASYFSYALGMFVLYFLYDAYISHKNQKKFWPDTNKTGRYLLGGTALFYLILLGDNLLLNDWQSVAKGVDIALLSVPFYMFFFLESKHGIGQGIRWGVLAGSTIITVYGLYKGLLGMDGRYESFFAHPNHFGTAIAMLCPFLCMIFWKEQKIWKKVGIGILILAMLFCLYKTGSRGAIAAFFVGVIISLGSMLWLYRSRISGKTKKMIGIFLVLICLIGGAAFGYLQSERKGAAKIGGERIIMLEASYEMWQDHKWMGIGMDRWGEYYYSPQYHPKTGHETNLSMPHNMFIYFLSTAGIWGGIGYLLFLGLSVWGLYKTAGVIDNPWLSAAMLAAFWAFTIQGLVDTTIINKIPSRIYFALMGYYMAVGNVHRMDKRENSETSLY